MSTVLPQREASEREPSIRRPPSRWFASLPFQLAATAVVGALVALPLTGIDADGFFWLSLTWMFWIIGTVWGVTRRRLALPFVALQVFMLISVLLPAATAYLSTGVNLFGVRYTTGIDDGLQMIALAQAGLTVGAMAIHIRPIDEAPRRLAVALPWRQVDRLAIGFGVAAVLGLVAYTMFSGASLLSANVFAAGTNYGDLQRDVAGPQVKYFLTIQSLFGSAVVLAVLRFTGVRSRYLTVPLIIVVVGVLFLAMGGQRQRLLVPLVTCGLIWWKTAGGNLPRALRTLAIVGGLVLFTASAFINVWRNDPIEGQEVVDTSDITAVLNDQAGERSDLFRTTVGLAENVPARYDYLDGESYLEIFVLPIPRAVWEDKPIGRMPELQGNFFDTRIGASFPEYGEMYANFGLSGMVVGCLLFGAAVQYTWVRFSRTEDLVGALWLSSLIPVLLLLFTRNYAAGIIAGQFGVFLGVWWTARRVRRWRRRGSVDVGLRG